MLSITKRLIKQYTQVKYNKFKVSRLPNQNLIFYLKQQTKIDQFLNQIRQNFKIQENQLIISSALTLNQGNIPQANIIQLNQQNLNSMFLQFLLSNSFFLYEKTNNKQLITYGIQCLQLNVTNNRNIPQRIQNAIIKLNDQWTNTNNMISALTFKNQIHQNESQQQSKKLLQKTSYFLQIINNSKIQKPLDNFIKKMTILMGINWMFLFGITFGGYGWDVGQPISYLTSLAVQFKAMSGIFNLQSQIQNQKMINQSRWQGMLNLTSQKNHQMWIYKNLKRQLL